MAPRRLIRKTEFVELTLLGILVTGGMGCVIAAPAPAASSASTQAATAVLADLQGRAREARQTGDWRAYQQAISELQTLLNDSPPSLLDSARAAIRLGDSTRAIQDLTDYARMGEGPELVDSLPELAELRSRPSFSAIQKRLVSNQRVVSQGTVVHAFSDTGLLPEDIDFDSKQHRFILSSVMRHKIVAVGADGREADLALAPDGWPLMALKIDASRGRLWVTEVGMEGFASVPPRDQGRSVLLRYDLATMTLVQRVEAPRPAALGDMALMPDGSPIVSDGKHGGVYRLSTEGTLERIDAAQFVSPQTPVIAPDGERILIPDYVRGLAILDSRTRAVTWFASQRRFALNGVDGMYADGQALILVQNGTSPMRISSLTADLRHTRILLARVLERSSRTLGVPTHGVCLGREFFYIANSGWDSVDQHGLPMAGARRTAPAIMKTQI